MTVRAFLPKDYEAVSEWWQKHGWSPVPLGMLPCGVVVENKAAGFLYQDKDVPYGMVEWVVANPENTPRESFKAIDLILKELIAMAKIKNLIALQVAGDMMFSIHGEKVISFLFDEQTETHGNT